MWAWQTAHLLTFWQDEDADPIHPYELMENLGYDREDLPTPEEGDDEPSGPSLDAFIAQGQAMGVVEDARETKDE